MLEDVQENKQIILVYLRTTWIGKVKADDMNIKAFQAKRNLISLPYWKRREKNSDLVRIKAQQLSYFV